MHCSQHDWLKLVRAKGVGNRTLVPLVRKAGNLDELFQLASTSTAEKLVKAVNSPASEQEQADLKWLENQNNHLIALSDPQYPELLRQISDPPLVLFAHGSPELLKLPQLAIVGSRNPTRTGIDNAFAFARHLAEFGIAITSGMALGIDAQAHQGCLAANGRTLAVIGTGTDRVYPASHLKLAHQISERGLIVSEFPPGSEPRPGHFPRRNRIISALSLGTLVVEATFKSGSLITANQAIEQGREVFAIPGSIHNPQSKGCHALIKQGAKLVENAKDIIDELASIFSTVEITDQPTQDETISKTGELDDDYQLLLDKMGWDPVSLDQMINTTRLSPEAVSSMLLLLELQGHVSSAPGGYFNRTIPSS